MKFFDVIVTTNEVIGRHTRNSKMIKCLLVTAPVQSICSSTTPTTRSHSVTFYGRQVNQSSFLPLTSQSQVFWLRSSFKSLEQPSILRRGVTINSCGRTSSCHQCVFPRGITAQMIKNLFTNPNLSQMIQKLFIFVTITEQETKSEGDTHFCWQCANRIKQNIYHHMSITKITEMFA